MKPLAIDIKLTGNLPVDGLCGKCRDSSLCYDTSDMRCDVMSDGTWDRVVEFLERINYSAEIGIQGHIEKDSSFYRKWDSIKKFCTKRNPAWVNVNWRYVTDDLINICGDNLRLIIRFGPCSFDNITIDPGFIHILKVLNSQNKKYIINIRIVEKEKTIDEIMESFNSAREQVYTILNNAGLDNAGILSEQMDFDLCLSDETDKEFNRRASVYICMEEIPLAEWYGYTDPVYKQISSEVCSSPMLLTSINWNGDISRCCFDYNFKKVEGNIHSIYPEDLFTGAEYCFYPVKCYEERPL